MALCLCTGLLQVTIRGQLFPHEGGTGKNVFLMPADQAGEHSSATIMCSVEELSLAHYCRQGYDQGRRGFSLSIPPSNPTVSNCLYHAGYRDPWGGLNIFNPVWPSIMGCHFHGGYSRCFPKSLPGVCNKKKSLMFNYINSPIWMNTKFTQTY